MGNRNIVSIGTSAGGVGALRFLASALPQNFPATVLVTIHLSREFPSEMDQILSRIGPLPASFARDGETPREGHIYLAPPNSHLLIMNGRLALGDGPEENHVRPAIDPMMRSVGLCCGGRAVGVVLTGLLSDGASGLWAVNCAGGVTIVQDPADAEFPEMPQSALNMLRPDYVVSLARMPGLLESLVHEPEVATRSLPERIRFEVEIAKDGHSTMETMDRIGQRSTFTCPECGGVMWQIDEGDLTRFRCHVGHSYGAELMQLALDEKLRAALETARRCHQERVHLMQDLAQRARASGREQTAEDWRTRAMQYQAHAAAIDDALGKLGQVAAGASESGPR